LKVLSLIRILLIDSVLFVFVYLVEMDLAFRNSYAVSLNFVPSTGYSVLTHILTLTGRGATLVSPLALDWVQLLIFALVAADIAYLARFLKQSRTQSPTQVTAPQSD
jgi:hypothetical protein